MNMIAIICFALSLVIVLLVLPAVRRRQNIERLKELGIIQ